MKQVFNRALRWAGYEVRALNGPRRISSMETALDWLEEIDVEVSTVLDVGASDGRWSVRCMKSFPDADYVLYEPQPVHRPALDEVVRRHQRVRHVAAAVGGASGAGVFDASDAFGGALAKDGSFGIDTVEVEVVTLDESAERLELVSPFLVKLDTHGFEREILEGASSVLERSQVLIVEAYAHRITSDCMYFWELCSYLFVRGFRPVDLVDVMHRERDGALWQMDLVFLRDKWPGFASNEYR